VLGHRLRIPPGTASAFGPPRTTPPGRLVVTGATVHTMTRAADGAANEATPVADAFAADGGRFVAVGRTSDVTAGREHWPTLHLDGATVVPGLIDAHGHLLGLGLSRLQADLAGAASPAEVVARLRAHADAHPDGWLLGRGWDHTRWPGGAFPTRHDLDTAFPDRPVWLSRVDGHADWGNAAALRAAGFDPDTPAPLDPEGGQIVRDADGRMTGVFVDAAAEPVHAAVPPTSAADTARALTLALDEASRHGLTGLHEAGVPMDALDLYAAAIDAGRFPLRLTGMIGPDELDAFADAHPGGLVHPSGRLRANTLKLFADGALGSRGAALLADYADAPGERGLLLYDPADLREIVTRAMRRGLQVATHAIGDAAARAVLDAYEAAIGATGGGPGRHRLEHAQVIADADVARLVRLGVIASVQPTHATSDWRWAPDRLGDRWPTAYRLAGLARAGARLALGSDVPVEPLCPLRGLRAAVTRRDDDGLPDGSERADEALSPRDALAGFTTGAAFAGFAEHEVGRIAVGLRADAAVLTADPLAGGLADARVAATLLDGEVVWSDGNVPTPG